MKNYRILVILVIMIAVMALPAHALESYGDMMAKRGGRGIINIAKSPVDLINTVEDVRYKSGYLSAFSYGVLKGAGIALARALYGAYEVATFYSTDLNAHTFQVNYDSAFLRI